MRKKKRKKIYILSLPCCAHANFRPDLMQADIPNGFTTRESFIQACSVGSENVLEVFEYPLLICNGSQSAKSRKGWTVLFLSTVPSMRKPMARTASRDTRLQ
ncbi:hypothetical protein FKM82_028460 [Ascaphus truei]